MLADSVDLGVMVVALGAIYLGVSAVFFLVDPRAFRFPSPPPGLGFTLGALLLLVYLAVGWSATGRTLGKQVLGLRVVNRRGRRLRPATASVRAALCLLFPIGLFWSAVSGRNASVQDLILGTAVVYDWKLLTPPRDQVPTPSESASAAKSG